MSNQFSHISGSGDPAMVNVADKKESLRTAKARGIVSLGPEIISLLEAGEIKTKKGAVFQTAIIAGIMAAKKTGELIPLCHPLGLDDCRITVSVENASDVFVECQASLKAKTGVEMEALTGVSVAALTIYDMCKALSYEIVIKEICLLEKTGGKKDFHRKG